MFYPFSGESNRPLTLIFLKSIAIHLPFLSRYFCKSMPSSWQKVVYTPPICITIRLPFVSRYFCRSIRVRGRWDSEKDFASQERVSGFPVKGLTSGGSPGNFRGSPGSSGEVWETSGEPLESGPGLLASSTVRELPGNSPKNIRGSLGNFRGSPGTFQKLGGL